MEGRITDSARESWESVHEWLVKKHHSERLRDRFVAINLKIYVIEGPALVTVALLPTGLSYLLLHVFPIESLPWSRWTFAGAWGIFATISLGAGYCFTTREFDPA